MEPSGRQHHMIQLVKASQQQQYAYEYIDDRGSFVRAQKAEEERIQQDMERALRAQRRNKARKIARASKAAEHAVTQSSTYEDWYQGENPRHAIIVPRSPPGQPPIIVPHAPLAILMDENGERGRLQGFEFPRLDAKTQVSRPPPLKFPAAIRYDLPLSSPKRLAPLSRFNPFVRARSESLSSLFDDEPPAREPVKKRNASVSALFARIHREAEYMRLRQG
ncbi:hypothetical protein DFH09DRAFT_1335423 [Mycena vulgaris]|nr:hypothetical protein DFH09DRAFT_1335423 [Mycena vulgaris]